MTDRVAGGDTRIGVWPWERKACHVGGAGRGDLAALGRGTTTVMECGRGIHFGRVEMCESRHCSEGNSGTLSDILSYVYASRAGCVRRHGGRSPRSRQRPKG